MDVPRRAPLRRWLVWSLLLPPLVFSYASAFLLREGLPATWGPTLLRTLPLVVCIKLLGLWAFSLHRGIWRYAGIHDLVRVAASASASSLAVLAVLLPLSLPVHTVSLVAIDFLLSLHAVLALRVGTRLVREVIRGRVCSERRRMVIVGAGDAGEALVRALMRDANPGIVPVAFVDDDPAKQGLRIHGVEVRGKTEDLPRVARSKDADGVLVAICRATGEDKARILANAQRTGLPVKRIPGLDDLMSGRMAIHQLQDVTLEDLLPRAPVTTDQEAVDRRIHGKRVLVTGAAGSIGSELCRQILRHEPDLLVLVDINENALFHMEHELASRGARARVVTSLCSVQDVREIDDVFRTHRPHLVFHAAAYKHVPVLEHFPEQAVRNNVRGTKVVAEAASRFRCDSFVLISTDKAVRPTSVMGTTKRVAELLVANLDRHSDTHFVTIRFGNVLGSNGSVLQLFREQIARGGPVTVTHADIRRYFMTIPEAVGLVLFAASMEDEGSTFILDMGEQVRILDMARHFIRLCGLEPDRDIPIEIVGLRPGEKLYEELWVEAEQPVATRHPSILRAPRAGTPLDGLERAIEVLIDWAEEHDRAQVVEHLRQLVPEYTGHPVCLDARVGEVNGEDVAREMAAQLAETLASVEEGRDGGEIVESVV